MGIGRQSACLSGCCLAGAGGRRAAAEFKEPLRDLGGFFDSAGFRPYVGIHIRTISSLGHWIAASKNDLFAVVMRPQKCFIGETSFQRTENTRGRRRR